MGTALSVNGPHWSLCYAVGYNVLPGFRIFAPACWGTLALAAVAAAAGQAVIAPSPVWCLGAWLATGAAPLGPRARSAGLSLAQAVLLVVGVAGLGLRPKDWASTELPARWHLVRSHRVQTDLPLGLLMAWHLQAIASLPPATHEAWAHRARAWGGRWA